MTNNFINILLNNLVGMLLQGTLHKAFCPHITPPHLVSFKGKHRHMVTVLDVQQRSRLPMGVVVVCVCMESEGREREEAWKDALQCWSAQYC